MQHWGNSLTTYLSRHSNRQLDMDIDIYVTFKVNTQDTLIW